MMFVIVLNEIAALALFHGADYLSIFQKQQLDAQAMLFLQVHGKYVQPAAQSSQLQPSETGRVVGCNRFASQMYRLSMLVEPGESP